MTSIKITDDNYNTVSINEIDIDVVNKNSHNKNITIYKNSIVLMTGNFNYSIKLSGTTFRIAMIAIGKGGFNEFSMGTKGDSSLLLLGVNNNNEEMIISIPIRIGNNKINTTLKDVLNVIKNSKDNISSSDAKLLDVESLIPKSEYYRYDYVKNNGSSVRQIMFGINDSLIVSRSQYNQIISKLDTWGVSQTTITRNTNGYTPLVKNKIGTKDVASKNSLFTCVPVKCDGDICEDADGNPFYDEEAAKKEEKKTSAIAEFLGDKQDSFKKTFIALLSIILCVAIGYVMYKLALKFVMSMSTGGTGGIRARVIDAR